VKLLENSENLGLSVGEPELNDFNTELFAEGFKALADPHRLRILHLLLRTYHFI